MNDSLTSDARTAPLPGGWILPFALSLLFVLAVAGWLEWSDRSEAEQSRQVLISDALSLERHITGHIETERERLEALARMISPGMDAATVAALPPVNEGLRRAWSSLTWLGTDHRVRLHLPETAPRSIAADNRTADPGLSIHLSATVPSAGDQPAGRLIARYSPLALLRGSVPWWLARQYEVRLIDSNSQIIAATGDLQPDAEHLTHRIDLEPALHDTWLELISRATPRPWWRTLPLALMLVFLLLIGLATWLLRRQMQQVSRAEERWRTEAAWRQAMEDSLTVGLRARDLEGRLIYANRSFAEMVGYPLDELMGRLPPMPYWAPDHLEETFWRHHRNLAGQAPREGYEARWRRRDGRMVDALVFEAPLVDAHGQHIGWMASIVNQTERKRLEEIERRQFDAMAHQARLTTLGEIASALAHELNQPLTAITGYNAGVLRLLRRHEGTIEPAILDALQRLGEQAAQAGRVVQRIREFLTRRGPQPEPADLIAIAREAVRLIARDLQQQRIEIQWAISDATLAAVQADPVLIEQVVINLVRNAADELTRPDSAGPRQIRLSVQSAGDFQRLIVEDSGRGLEGRGIDTLAAPFHSTKAEGMGMGLAICRSIIEAHHGALDCGTSALGGALFAFTLPLSSSHPSPEVSDDPAAHRR
jgi:two-component system sensor histidine kinase DctS